MSDANQTTDNLPPLWEWLGVFKMARMRDGTLVSLWSDEVDGLLVSGHSVDEVLRKLPGAYAEIMDANNAR